METKYKNILRSVYVFEFIDNSIYVGITKDLKKRHMDHKHCGKVSKKIKEGIKYKFKVLKYDLMPEKALDMEEFYINKYRKAGYIVLNSKNPVRSLGSLSCYIWSYEELKKEASKYTSRKRFEEGNPRAYKASYRKGLIDEFFKDIPKLFKNWTNEELFLEAKKYNTRYEFSCNSHSAYKIVQSRGLLKEACSHMVKSKTVPKRIYWVEYDRYFEGIRELTRFIHRSRYFVRTRLRGIKKTKGYTFLYVNT